MNNIDSLTLEYFLNKNQYQGLLNKHELFNDKQFLSDRKFYKKRIIDTTKKLFRNEINDSHLKNSFNCYIKSCINYLSFLDKTDIIQDKYIEETDNIAEEKCLENIAVEEYNNCDYLLTKESDVKQVTLLDNYIKKKDNKPKIILPEKNTYNLKTSEFKTKGISKKKNINIKYDENKKA